MGSGAHDNEGEEAKHVLIGVAVGVVLLHVTLFGAWLGATAAAYFEGGSLDKAKRMGVITNLGVTLVVVGLGASYLLVHVALGGTLVAPLGLAVLTAIFLVLTAVGGAVAGRFGHWIRYQTSVDITL